MLAIFCTTLRYVSYSNKSLRPLHRRSQLLLSIGNCGFCINEHTNPPRNFGARVTPGVHGALLYDHVSWLVNEVFGAVFGLEYQLPMYCIGEVSRLD